jgi:large subunit ribosomal protein L2
MIKKVRPVTSGTRNRIDLDRSDLHKGTPEKSLLKGGHLKRQGRGFRGHITVRHRGGGVKKRLRVVDFVRSKVGVTGVVKRIEYDPNRSANIALIYYVDGAKSYIIAPEGLQVGDKINNQDMHSIKTGSALKLRDIPVGVPIHNLELEVGRGARLVRSAGAAAVIQSKDGDWATVLLPSKEVRVIKLECTATIGQVGNVDHKNAKLGKAGRKRLMGVRPGVRGTAMHPGAHPHGGGEGRSGIGLKHPKTPWGKPALGYKTRKNRRSDKFIVKDRRKK